MSRTRECRLQSRFFGVFLGCLLLADFANAVNMRRRIAKLQCTRKRRDTLHLTLKERVKRCSGGGGGGGGGFQTMERITVIGSPIRDPFADFAIRNIIDSLTRPSGIDYIGETGGGGVNRDSEQDKDCYGKVEKVQTSGASAATSGQDRLQTTGTSASNTMAHSDLSRLNQYKSKILQVSKETGMDAAVIAAIISRESRAGNALSSNGYGKYDSNGFGLMQVDKNYHTPQGAHDSVEHTRQGVQILQGMIKGVRDCHPAWSNEQVLKGGISAYNAGVRNVRNYDRMDVGTTGDDYANDVVARAQYLKKNGFSDPKDQKCSGSTGQGRRKRGTCPYSWFNPSETRPGTSKSKQGLSGSAGKRSQGSSSSSSGSSRPSLPRFRESFDCSGSRRSGRGGWRRCQIP